MQGGLFWLNLFHSLIALLLRRLYPSEQCGVAHTHMNDAGRGGLHDSAFVEFPPK
jgi:hypothetical protein